MLEEIQTRMEHVTAVISEAKSSNPMTAENNYLMEALIDEKEKIKSQISEQLIKAYKSEGAVERFINKHIENEQYKTLLLLRYVNGYSTNLIAELLNVSQRTVQRDIKKALLVAQSKYERKNGGGRK